MDSAIFDLQLVSTNGPIGRTRLPGTLDVSDIAVFPTDEWLSGLVADVDDPNVTGLRDLLRLLGTDILGGREVMRPLCQFRNILDRSPWEGALDDAISFITKDSSLGTSKLAKRHIADTALGHPRSISERAMRFLLDHLSLVDDKTLFRKKDALGHALWERHPALLFELLDGDSELQPFAYQIVGELPVDELVCRWPSDEETQERVLRLRQDVVTEPAFWSAIEVWPKALNGLGAELKSAAATAMVQGLENEQLIAAGMKAIGELASLKALEILVAASTPVKSARTWVRAACKNLSAVAMFLSESVMTSGFVLQSIAYELPTDAVPNASGQDPWVQALSRLRQSENALPVQLCAYGFRRALGRSSRSKEELFQLTFEQLHGAARNSELGEPDWELIENLLPWASADLRWDRCLRIRKALANAYVARHLWAGAFAWVAESEDLFQLVLKEVVDEWGGQRFLREVQASLRNKQDDFSKQRRRLIREFLKSTERS
ncbi:hypothetical protein [Rhodanobacter sp. MP1X3]|uniref:hypothetical protein n=1 Tax=Rhodanobacter sp. MP1X3 TaxID=2723086 RepID=UPI00161ED21C|nr:hypothetical protein [Rhodanobacter sp. MP1X3]MBB6241980.1 hypothetical protein [Rhodanobacter sp. MP1X3]